MSKKARDAFKAKEKKQRIIAGVGGLVLVALLVIQVPKVMKQLNKGKGGPAVSAAVAAPSVGTPTPSLVAPNLRGAEQGTTSPGATGGQLVVSSTGAVATQGQLASFSRFASKDPFSQQVSSGAAPTGSGSAKPTSSGGSAGSPGSVSTGTASSTRSAVISVNGTLMSVTAGDDFPQPTATDPTANPFFHLVSVTATTAKISIAGGSYANGAATVTLRVGKAVTLMNTADGSRYRLILKPRGTAVTTQQNPGMATATPTATPTSTVPLPPPTP
jgi:hypothetical protein